MSENKLAELVEEYLAHLRAGETLSSEAFAANYPEYSAQLLEVLPSLAALEELTRTQIMTQKSVSKMSYPDQLGEFLLSEKLGSGGMGTVFKALQSSLNREVAIKILAPIWSDSTDLVRKFENESKLIATLHHPHIVQVFGAGREGDYSFYVMELIKGAPLDINVVRSPSLVARLGLQAAEALAYAHSNHILHRDIKPGNLLLDDQGELHVSDFGIATMLNDNELAVTQSRDGTLRYMAPEQFQSNCCSCASDQYSLGATLYELLSNKPLFKATSEAALIKMIDEHQIKPLEQFPRDLAAIIMKSLAYSPGERYKSLTEMAADLRRFLEGQSVKARPSSRWRRMWLWAKRRPAVAFWSICAVVMALGVVAALLNGYYQTRRALNIADRTLNEIFTAYADQPGAGNTALLERLLPYYEIVAAGKQEYANEILGRIALRSGKPEVAERAFRRTSNRLLLAESLAQQKKETAAEELWRELAQNRDITAVYALRSLGGQLRAMPGKETLDTGGNPELMLQAWNLLTQLRAEKPDDPELRFLAATLCSENPRLGQGENTLEQLKTLVTEYSERPAYRLLLVRVAGKINPRNTQFDEQMTLALEQGEELLINYPNEPEVLVTVADVRLKYAAALAQKGRESDAITELERAVGLYEIIARNPNAPSEALEKLSEFKTRLAGFKRRSERNNH